MRFYKGSLTRRLILDTSIDNELEESIVIQLRVRNSEKKIIQILFVVFNRMLVCPRNLLLNYNKCLKI
jgi:hypothetical protein